MHRVSWERPQGQDPEPSPRPLSQARVYLEQIRNRVTVSGQDRLSSGKTPTGKRDYLVDAAKQIRQALDNEVSEDYEAAFNHYKNGVDLLLKGIQVDSNRERREAVKRKITQYLKRAEEIFNCHLQKSLGNSTSQSEGFSSFRLRPIRILSSPVEHLKSCKVIGVIDKVLLAQDPSLEETFVVKSLCKSTVETRHRQTIIPQGVPYMVQLLRYYVSEDAIFLHLEHIQGGKLWSQLRKCHHPNSERVKEYPECSSPRHRTTQLKTSHTSPALRLLGDEQEVTQSHRKEVNTAECSDCSACTLPSNRPSDQVSGAGNWFIGDQSGHQRSNTDQSVSQEDATCPPGTEHSACCCDTSTSCRDTSTSLATCSGGTAREEKGCCSAQTLSATEDFKPDNQRETGCKSGLVNGNKSLRSHGFVFANSCNGLSKHGPRFHDQSNQVGSTGNARTLMENTGLQKCLDIVEGPIMQTDLKGCYQIVVSPLEAVQQNIQPMSDLKESGLIPGSDSGAMPIRNMADTVSGKGLSELRTAAVNTLSPADQPCLVRHLQPAYPGREGAQRTSLEAGTQEEVTSDMGLQSSLHEGISVTIQSKSQHCCTNSEEPRVSTGGENGCNRSPSSPDEDMHIEVDGWCLVSSSPARKNKKPVHVPGGFTEDQICQWTAEIILALESIHQQGIICRDLNPRNILLDSAGHVCLTYFGQWGEIEPQCSSRAMEDLFCAPEVGGISEVTEACDWWSLGALLYELLTGMSLSQHYPSGINASTQLQIPKNLSTAAASLLTELLQYDAACRLGAGVDGVKKIKAHPFFQLCAVEQAEWLASG